MEITEQIITIKKITEVVVPLKIIVGSRYYINPSSIIKNINRRVVIISSLNYFKDLDFDTKAKFPNLNNEDIIVSYKSEAENELHFLEIKIFAQHATIY